MKVKEILDMSVEELNKLTESELRGVAHVLNSAANKRISNIQAKKVYSPAVSGAMNNQGKFTLKGKETRNEVLKEVYRAKGFLTNKTSTVKGAEQSRKEITDVFGTELTEKQEKRLWRVYDRLKEKDPAAFFTGGCYDKQKAKDIQKTIANEIENNKGYGVDRLTDLMVDRLEDIYEDEQETYDDMSFYDLF